MKKLPVIALLSVFAVLLFTSCRKDYICNCKMQLPSLSLDTSFSLELKDTVISFDIDRRKKKEAEAECRGAESGYKAISGGFLPADCSIERD